MSSIAEANRVRELERRCDDLEARLAVVERAESFEQSESVARRPGRPRKQPEQAEA